MAAGTADDLLQHLLLLLQQKGQQLSRRVHPERLQARQHPFDKPQRFEARRHHQPGATVEPQRGGFRAGILRTKQHIVKHSEQIFPLSLNAGGVRAAADLLEEKSATGKWLVNHFSAVA